MIKLERLRGLSEQAVQRIEDELQAGRDSGAVIVRVKGVATRRSDIIITDRNPTSEDGIYRKIEEIPK